MQFTLPLKETAGSQQRHATTLHLMLAFLLVSIGATCEVLYWFTGISKAFEATGGAYRPFLIFGIACLLAGIVILALTIFGKQWVRREGNNRTLRVLELILMAGSSLLFFLHGWTIPAALFGMMSAVIVFAIIREKAGARPGDITVDAAGIHLPTAAGRRLYKWREIDKVLLRYGTLSVECTENRLVQRNVGEPPFSPASLEAYSREQIEAHRAERVNHDW